MDTDAACDLDRLRLQIGGVLADQLAAADGQSFYDLEEEALERTRKRGNRDHGEEKKDGEKGEGGQEETKRKKN